jgi:hypothetical protein
LFEHCRDSAKHFFADVKRHAIGGGSAAAWSATTLLVFLALLPGVGSIAASGCVGTFARCGIGILTFS